MCQSMQTICRDIQKVKLLSQHNMTEYVDNMQRVCGGYAESIRLTT